MSINRSVQISSYQSHVSTHTHTHEIYLLVALSLSSKPLRGETWSELEQNASSSADDTGNLI